MIIEYLKESELGRNYHKNYIIHFDEQTKQPYILDYTQKYKYFIIPDTDTQSTGANTGMPSELDKLRYNYGYVDENELKLIDLTNIKIYKDDLKNEYYIQDINNLNRRWIILPQNWNDESNSDAPYINEDDVDLLKWIVHLDTNSNRKYIVDERTETYYYLVPSDHMMEFRRYWSKFYKSQQEKQQVKKNNENATTTVSEVLASPTEHLIIEYVDEDELATMDLLGVKVKKDDFYNEYFIQNPLKSNHRWVVLPRNWRTKQAEHYISDEDFNQKDYIIYLDANKRRYIRDDKTNRCYFIVPTHKDTKQTFKHKWSQINETLKRQPQQQPEAIKSPKLEDKNKIRVIEPAEIRQLQQSPRAIRHQLTNQQIADAMQRKPPTTPIQPQPWDPTKRVRSPSNDILERGSSAKAPVGNRFMNQNQRFNSTDNLLTSDSGGAKNSPNLVKKQVYFNENVKVSDGTNEYNDKIQKFDDHDGVYSVKRHNFIQFQPQMPQQQQQPSVKPRIMKPIGAVPIQIEATMPVSNYSSLNVDRRIIQTSNGHNEVNKAVFIKQHGRPGHLVRPTNNQNSLNR